MTFINKRRQSHMIKEFPVFIAPSVVLLSQAATSSRA